MKLIPDNFLSLPDNTDLEKARAIIVPFGFEATTTYGKGTKNGPAAIIAASIQVERFDEELWQETYKTVGIVTLEIIKSANSFAAAKKQIQQLVEGILKEQKFPLILGGEHSITPFIIGSYQKSGFKDFSILQFDAHADLRDGYLGQKYSHAAAMRRCLDLPGINLVQIGIRNISSENNELNFWQKNQNRIKTFWAKDKKSWNITEIIKNFKEKVYLTFDVDVFDPSFMPSTGTPEPGGLDWYKVTDILREVCKTKKIIGADFVELAPIKGLVAPDFMIAKLIYKFIGYAFAKQLIPLNKF